MQSVLNHILVPDPIFLQLLRHRVNVSIEFDDQVHLRAHEVDHVRADGLLPAETRAEELVVAEVGPEQALCGGDGAAQFSCALAEERAEVFGHSFAGSHAEHLGRIRLRLPRRYCLRGGPSAAGPARTPLPRPLPGIPGRGSQNRYCAENCSRRSSPLSPLRSSRCPYSNSPPSMT